MKYTISEIYNIEIIKGVFRYINDVLTFDADEYTILVGKRNG